ncbi:hypothetical protein D349_00128 [Enterococcus faecalis UP2S-6]|nr:hypothetical protein D349_00128 [Enterococcus faecalis UP2S-6]
MINTKANAPNNLAVAPGQFPKKKTPQREAPKSWNAVVTGMARDEPIIVKHLNVMICAQAQPTPDKIEKNKSMPAGKVKPLIIENTAAKINVPKLVPRI